MKLSKWHLSMSSVKNWHFSENHVLKIAEDWQYLNIVQILSNCSISRALPIQILALKFCTRSPRIAYLLVRRRGETTKVQPMQLHKHQQKVHWMTHIGEMLSQSESSNIHDI